MSFFVRAQVMGLDGARELVRDGARAAESAPG